MPAKGSSVAGFFVFYLGNLIIFQSGFFYLFRMRGDDLKFAAALAFLSRVCEFFMALMLVAIFATIAFHFTPTVPGTNGSAYYQVPVSQLPHALPPPPDPTKLDEQIVKRLNQGSANLMEARAWKKMQPVDASLNDLIDQEYKADAGKVYIDFDFANRSQPHPGLHPTRVIVQLPRSDAERATCLDVAQAYVSDNGLTQTWDDKALSRQYLEVDLK
jgi:hypothetical protein